MQVPGSGSRATTAVVSAMIASPSIRGERGGHDEAALTSSSGFRGRSTPEAGARSGSCCTTPWQWEQEQSNNIAVVSAMIAPPPIRGERERGGHEAALTSKSGSRGHSTPEAGARSGSLGPGSWQWEQEQSNAGSGVSNDSVTVNQRGGGERRGGGVRRFSHLSQAPEGAPLQWQGPGQGVAVQVPGSGSRSRATIAVVSETIAPPSHREERVRGDMRRFSHLPQAPESAPLPRQGPGQGVVTQVSGSARGSRTAPAVVSAMIIVSPSLKERRGERGGGHAAALTSHSGSRGRSTPEAGARSGSCGSAPWQCEQEQSNAGSGVSNDSVTANQRGERGA